MALAVDTVGPAFDATKKVFIPIRRKFWFKLGLVYLFAAKGSSGGGNSNFNAPGNGADFTDVFAFLRKYLVFIIGGIIGLVILGWLWSIVAWSLTFVFMHSVMTGEVRIREGLKNFIGRGFSYFLFRFVWGLLHLVILVLAGLPLIMTVVNNWGNLSWSMFSIPYLIIYGLFVIAYLILIWGILMFIFENFVFTDMYMNNVKAWRSFKRMLRLIRKEIKEVLIYFLMRFALRILIIMAGMIIVLVTLIPLAIVAIPIIFGFIAVFTGGTIDTKWALGSLLVIISIAVMFLWAYMLSVLTAPLDAFMRLHSYKFLEALKNRNKKLSM
jgi:hypothetical protein